MVDSKVIETEEFLDWPVIGKGAERTCYQNPNDLSRGIKVSNKGSAKQTLREIKFFEKLKKNDCSFKYIPDYYGKVETSELLGIEQEIIRNEDNSVSMNISEYMVQKEGLTGLDEVLSALSELKAFLIENRIIPSDLVVSNLLVKEVQNRIELNLIDGFGNTEFIPISDLIPFFNEKKINRKFEKFLSVNLYRCIKRSKSDEELNTFNEKMMSFKL